AAADPLATARRPRGAARAGKPLLMPALAAHALRRRETADAPPRRPRWPDWPATRPATYARAR
ncbi:hypothetical protein LJ221_20375, partial [Streptomyces sp. CNQ085]|nr:hypothetical protein [Streptomyces sp. CNQ085]